MPMLRDIADRLAPHLLDPFVDEKADEGRHQAAVALVLRELGDSVEVLLIKRADNPRDHWSGHIAFPGGRWHAADITLAATALRETREEVGIELATDSIVGRMRRLSPQNPRLPRIDITPFVVLAYDETTVSPNHEVAAGFWVPLDDLITRGASRVVQFDFDGERHEFPAYQFGEHLIWGLTERILTELLGLLVRSQEVERPHGAV